MYFFNTLFIRSNHIVKKKDCFHSLYGSEPLFLLHFLAPPSVPAGNLSAVLKRGEGREGERGYTRCKHSTHAPT